jgi:uncharacterized protein (UPF0335 family)
MSEGLKDADLKLRRIVENIERLEEEKKEISRQISDVLGEAKTFGFDIRIIRKIITLRRMDPEKRMEMEQLMDVYKKSLGMMS